MSTDFLIFCETKITEQTTFLLQASQSPQKDDKLKSPFPRVLTKPSPARSSISSRSPSKSPCGTPKKGSSQNVPITPDIDPELLRRSREHRSKVQLEFTCADHNITATVTSPQSRLPVSPIVQPARIAGSSLAQPLSARKSGGFGMQAMPTLTTTVPKTKATKRKAAVPRKKKTAESKKPVVNCSFNYHQKISKK